MDGLWERSRNFKRVLDVLFDGSLPDMLPETSPSALSNGNNIDAGPPALTALGRWYPNYANLWSGETVEENLVNSMNDPLSLSQYFRGQMCKRKGRSVSWRSTNI